MKCKRYLIKLTNYGLALYGSHELDLAKPFIVEGYKDNYYLQVTGKEKKRLGIYSTHRHIYVKFRHYSSPVSGGPTIIIIHEDI